MPIHQWTTVEPLGPVWPFIKGLKHRSGRPRHTWLRTIESNLAPLDIGLSTTYRWAQNRQAWSTLIGMTTSSTRQATGWWWWWWWWCTGVE